MAAFDVTVPLGTEAISNGDDRIREFKTQLQSFLTSEGHIDATNLVFGYAGLKDITANRPAASTHGLFFDTTRQVLQRDNGATWDDVGTNIPAGTVCVFYQASAPTGWTAVAVNDKFLRVVTAGGSGGTTGGGATTPSATVTLAHSHTVSSHTHDMKGHTHTVAAHHHDVTSDTTGATGGTAIRLTSVSTTNANLTTDGPSDNTTTAATPGTDSQLSNFGFAYADVIVASKN